MTGEAAVRGGVGRRLCAMTGEAAVRGGVGRRLCAMTGEAAVRGGVAGARACAAASPMGGRRC
jgi:hypothetical protein